jgi:RNA polymerase sigma factor (sigma-70 family)
MVSDNSVSEWIAGLKQGELNAIQKLWDRYRDQLLALARRKLGEIPKRVADEEDVAQSVFHSFYRGAMAGRFDDVKSRDDLWWLLLAITKQKAVDLIRHEMAQKRGGGQVQFEASNRHDSQSAHGIVFDQLVGDDPTPEFVVMLEEQQHRLMGLLRDDRLREIARSRIEGYTIAEIADGLAVSTRSVERKLQLIRNAWARDLLGGH